MRYAEFSFENFKGIEEMTVKLDGHVTTLIGLNESGKTTILEAIFCFSYGAENLEALNPGMASLRNPEQWIPIAKRANFNEPVTISAVVDLSEEDRRELTRFMRREHRLTLHNLPVRVEIKERYFFSNSRHTDTKRFWTFDLQGVRGQQRNPRVYRSTTPEWRAAVRWLIGRLPRIWYFPNFLFELPERFDLSVSAAAQNEERDRDKFYRSTFEQVLEQLGYGANLDTHVVERLQSTERADRRSLDAVLLDMGRRITTTIFEGWDRIFGRPPAAQEVELQAEMDEFNKPYLELRIKGPDGYYDLSERSLGFRWFFMFLLMTSFQGEASNDAKPLFLLDEPASNLHSSAQAELLKSFERLLDRCVLIYTTHSHHLINVKWLDSALVVKNAALGSLDFSDYMTSRMGARTAITAERYRRFVTNHPEQTSYFQPVLDLLDYKPSTLEPVPDVVLVEGKTDFFLLRYFLDVLCVPGRLHAVPGGGAGTLDPLIRLYIGWAKPFLVLLDGDSEGKKQRERYDREFGALLRDRCLLLGDVCSEAAVTEIENLLTSQDIDLLIASVFRDDATRPGRKKALHQAVRELYARRETILISDESRARVKALVAAIDARLRAQGSDGDA